MEYKELEDMLGACGVKTGSLSINQLLGLINEEIDREIRRERGD